MMIANSLFNRSDHFIYIKSSVKSKSNVNIISKLSASFPQKHIHIPINTLCTRDAKHTNLSILYKQLLCILKNLIKNYTHKQIFGTLPITEIPESEGDKLYFQNYKPSHASLSLIWIT